MALLVLVEACRWSYSAALFSGHLWLTTRAGAEAMVAATVINNRPWLRHLWVALLPLFVFVLALGPLIAPFDLEQYFAFHFAKVFSYWRSGVLVLAHPADASHLTV